MSEAPDRSSKSFWTTIEPLFGPLVEYFRAVHVWIDPRQLAERIRNDQIDLADLVKLMAASAILTVIFMKLLPDAAGDFLFGIPVLDEIALALVFVVGGLLNALLAYPFLRWFGGTGTLKWTTIGCVYGVAAFFPILQLLSGLYWIAAHRDLPGGVNLGGTVWYYTQIYAGTHQLSRGKALGALALSLVACIVIVGFCVIVFLAFSKAA